MANRYQDPPFSADDQDRGYEPARPKGEGDPLAELARLIGQTDPFANFGRASQAPRPDDHQQPEDVDDVPSSPPPWLQRANAHSSARHDAARPDSTRQDFETLHPVQRYADEHQEPEPDYHQAPAFAAPADHQHPEDPDRYDQALYGELPGQHAPGHETYQDDAYAYADGYDDATEQPARKRGGGMMTVAVVLALAVVGTGAAFGYRTYMGSPRSGEPPVIKADTGPNKVVPPSATASADSNGKLIQDRLGGAAPEKLVSREEQPVNVQDATKAGPRVVFPPLNQNNNPPPTASVAPPAAGKALTGSATVQSDEPRKIRTFAVRGDSDSGALAAVAVAAGCTGGSRTAGPRRQQCPDRDRASSGQRRRVPGADRLAAQRSGCPVFVQGAAGQISVGIGVPFIGDQAGGSRPQGRLLPRHGRTVRIVGRGGFILRQSEKCRRTVRRPKELTAVSLTLGVDGG
jgi:hypothetical protein